MALTSGSKILVSDITNGLNDKMPITGGTVTGSIFRRNVDNLYLAICGGSGDPTSHTSGSVLAWGKDHASYPGYSALWAADGTNTAKLVLTPTGKCTAAGKDVVRSINNIEADDAGNVTLSLTASAMPNYSGAVTKSLNTDYTADKDGWISFYMANPDDKTSTLVIAGVTYTFNFRTSSTESGNQSALFMYPIPKSTKYRANTYGTLKFYPCKG